jgi:tetratricopeptide (TPR) repeat protein
LVQERLVVTGNGVRFRESGSSSSRALGITSRNDVVGKIRQQGNWCEVELATGATGWISHNYLRPLDVSLVQGSTTNEKPADDQAPGSGADLTSENETEPEPAAESGAARTAEEHLEVVPNHYANGLRYESDGNYAAALESFEKVLEADPDKVTARRRAALAHRQLGNLDAALEHLY